MRVDAFEGWTQDGHTWWEVGIPEISRRAEIDDARGEAAEGRKRQRKGV
jgi:3D-(3,5/4)-trihydroxycyclohexane-1,2-dione acylhydrolase (decyclizing)